MKGASNARVIWRIDLEFDEAGLPVVEMDVIEVGVGIEPDADYALLDRKWRDQLLEKFPFLEARVGTAAFPMDATEETVRSREAAWANFIVDQMPLGLAGLTLRSRLIPFLYIILVFFIIPFCLIWISR